MTTKTLSLSLLICLMPLAAAVAQEAKDILSVHVLTGTRTAADRHISALHLKLKPGWKTYWRAPGEAGIPPSFSWEGSKNIAAVDVLWPRPIVFHQYGLRSIGYKDEVILPLDIQPRTPGSRIELSGEISLGICQDICIPHRVKFSAVLPADQSPLAPQIKNALRQRPKTAKAARLRSRRCQFTPAQSGMMLKVKLDMPSTGTPEHAAIETTNPLIWVDPPTASRADNILSLQTLLTHSAGQPFALTRDSVRITVFGSDYAVDIQGCSGG